MEPARAVDRATAAKLARPAKPARAARRRPALRLRSAAQRAAGSAARAPQGGALHLPAQLRAGRAAYLRWAPPAAVRRLVSSPGAAPAADPQYREGSEYRRAAEYQGEAEKPESQPGLTAWAAAGRAERHPASLGRALPAVAPGRAWRTDPGWIPAESCGPARGFGTARGYGAARGFGMARGYGAARGFGMARGYGATRGCAAPPDRAATGPAAVLAGQGAPLRRDLLAGRTDPVAPGRAGDSQAGDRRADGCGRFRPVRHRDTGRVRQFRAARRLRSRSSSGRCAADRLSGRAGPPVSPTAEPTLA
jgi:hypothetical protein